ncbi:MULTISPECIES: hypothetical protein, partial [Streptomyces]|uniref:hypothetical protein n=1 Tax=Streptomyces TaxID=1883 RepID=UPI00131A57F1
MISIEFVDKAATRIGEAVTASNNLAPSQSAEEEAQGLDRVTGTITCKITDVTRYAPTAPARPVPATDLKGDRGRAFYARRAARGRVSRTGSGLSNERLCPVVGGDGGCLSGEQDAVAEEVESCASVHLSHDPFGAGV